jgi:transcriptional regulator
MSKIHDSLDVTEENISEVEGTAKENIQNKTQGEKRI